MATILPGLSRFSGSSALQRLHQPQGHGVLVEQKFVALEEADAMLRRDRTTALGRRIMHDAIEAMPLGQEGFRVHSDGLAEVEMDVPVADMPEGADAQAGHGGLAVCRRFHEEIRDAADRHRDIVLDRGALMLLVFGEALAQMPESLRLRFARSERRILDFPGFKRGFENLQQERLQIGP